MKVFLFFLDTFTFYFVLLVTRENKIGIDKVERRMKMVNIPQNPILFGDSLWLYDKEEQIPKYKANKRKGNLKKTLIIL